MGVFMIIVIVALIVGWVLLTISGLRESTESTLYLTLLTVGSLLFLLVLSGIVTYLTLTIKAINLTRRQSNFIDSVTHELKSPIASLKLYLETMELRKVTDEERERFQQFMMADVKRLDDLINHLLDAGYVDRSRDEDGLVEVELDSLIRHIVDTVCVRYRLDPAVFELDLRPTMIRAFQVDADMVFRNLIDNAVKYAGEPPKVHISMRHVGWQVITEIADNGDGIPKGLRRKVFGRFVRLGEELQRKKPGTGLGLYIVRTLVGRLGGRVSILDRDRRQGTVFEVRLPLARAEPPHLPVMAMQEGRRDGG